MKSRYLKHLPYLCFLVLLVLLYIANAHAADKKMYKIQQLKKELSETENRYNEVKSGTSLHSTESIIGKKVDLERNPNVPIVIGGN